MMSSFIVYNGITVKCGHCGQNDRDVHVYIWWANQHGAMIRVFCRKCDRYTDYKKLNKGHVLMRLGATSLRGTVPVLPKSVNQDWHEC